MSTVNKTIADRVIAGEYQDDNWIRIIKYTNAWGGDAYGLENARTLGKYSQSQYVRNPEVYWEAKQ